MPISSNVQISSSNNTTFPANSNNLLLQSNKNFSSFNKFNNLPQEIKLYYLVLLIALGLIVISIALLIYIKLQGNISNDQQQPGLISDRCFIQNQEFLQEATNSANECQVCKPDKDISDWSSKDEDTSCGEGFGVCKQGQCVPSIAPFAVPAATESSRFSP